MRVVLIAIVLVLVAGCASRSEPPPAEPEPARARAALATLHVDNRSEQRISVFYRLSARSASEVGIGQVSPEGFATLAPVPAGEPLLLVARTPAGAQLALPARAFEINGEWTWVIPPDARFVPAPPMEAWQ